VEHLMSQLSSCNPLVSIVIPTYNRAFCIDRVISSVINQTLTDWELIVVDNNSTDNTEEVINDFLDERISIVKIQNDGIVAKSRNLGIKLANGTFVAFLDSDDWWMPKKLEIALHQLELGSDLVYHDLYKISKVPIAVKKHPRIASRALSCPVFSDLLTNGNAIWNSSVVLRRRLLGDIGGFSEDKDLVGSEDFDGWLRIAKLTEKFEKLEGVLGYYWDGGGNLTSAKITLKSTLFLSDRYEADLRLIGGETLPGWIVYSLARSSLVLEDFAEARRYSLLTLKSTVPNQIRLKAAVTWVISALKF
tara:strand:+ start:4362 stop:5276 length:915 start_codon:yes stop_codon:yes gene_type:complete